MNLVPSPCKSLKMIAKSLNENVFLILSSIADSVSENTVLNYVIMLNVGPITRNHGLSRKFTLHCLDGNSELPTETCKFRSDVVKPVQKIHLQYFTWFIRQAIAINSHTINH